ncbi:hypothetical protein VU07_03850, partial [Desulfobulbus sp. F4]|nr:hypothetical protein [Desulfobulbus sp. F4]
MPTRKTSHALLAALLMFAVLLPVCKIVLSGAAIVEAEVELDHRDRLQIYYTGGGDFSEKKSAFSEMIEPGLPQTARITLQLAPARKLRLDLGDQPGTLRLHRLTVAAAFADNRVL